MANGNGPDPTKPAKARLAQDSVAGLTFVVYDGGTIGVLGLQRFPVTMHASQWRTLLAQGKPLAAFVDAAIKAGISPAERPATKPATNGVKSLLATK